MTLFDECAEVLNANFNIVEGEAYQHVIDILYKYPIIKGHVVWPDMNYSDYESIDVMLNSKIINDDDVFVFADDANIPIFRTNISLIAENIYDVTVLSPKIFIFNDTWILEPLFPTDTFRFARRPD